MLFVPDPSESDRRPRHGEGGEPDHPPAPQLRERDRGHEPAALDLQQVLAECDADGFGAVGGTELREDGMKVVTDGRTTDAKLGADIVIGTSDRDGVEDVKLFV